MGMHQFRSWVVAAALAAGAEIELGKEIVVR